MATTSGERIIVLDIIRGIAVMGIFSVNVVGMAMIESAYFYPPDYGFHSLADRIMWAANFLIVDGRFRALFSILFGASTLLVTDRAIAAGKAGWQVHFPRMAVLLLFGLAHYYLLWWGDILANYALVGMIAYAFIRMEVRQLMVSAGIALAVAYLPVTIIGIMEYLAGEQSALSAPAGMASELAAEIAADKAAHQSIAAHLAQMTESAVAALRPFTSVPGYGVETLGLMLLGMAGYRSGFLTGSWPRRSYVKVALATLLPMFAYHLAVVWLVLDADFARPVFRPLARMVAAPLHPVGAIGYTALIILLFPTRGAPADRVAAVGRAAFTNYLGATIFGTLLFYEFGFGLYGDVSRGQAWLFAPLLWAIMLLWSKPWLDRYRYGPFEWAWRSLARWRLEPMRRSIAG